MSTDRSTTAPSHNELAQDVPAAQPGDLVNSHGSLHEEHGRYVVVDAGDVGETPREGRLVLAFWPDGDITLPQVRPASMTPTGERVPLCSTCHLPRAMHHPCGDSGRVALIVRGRGCTATYPQT